MMWHAFDDYYVRQASVTKDLAKVENLLTVNSVSATPQKAEVTVAYSYKEGERVPIVEKIQTIPSTGSKPNQLTAACAMHLSPDEKHLFCSNAGDNTVSMYDRDDETGMLTMRFCLPISGDYPRTSRSSRTESIWHPSTTREVFPSLRSTMKKVFSS